MDIQTLETQSWALVCKLSKIIEVELAGHYVRYSTPQMKKRLYRAHSNAYERFKRRQEKLFNYQPGGFAPSPVLSPGVVGQGALS